MSSPQPIIYSMQFLPVMLLTNVQKFNPLAMLNKIMPITIAIMPQFI